MSTIPSTLARVGTAVAATAAATALFATPAHATIKNFVVGVASCSQPQTQTCKEIPTKLVATRTGDMVVQFTANRNHCSDIIAAITLDGRVWGQQRVGPGQSDGSYFIHTRPGRHQVGVRATGIRGGCNVGYLSAWGGTLRIETDADAADGIG